MNCDQVFDILTRGPFRGDSAREREVEQHLVACHECRELAEALRPAVDLFHEQLSSAEGAELPGYEGSLPAVEQMVTAVLTAAEETRPATAPQPAKAETATSRGRRNTLWLVLSSVALSGFAVGLWCAAMINAGSGGRPRLAQGQEVPQLLRLASLNAPTVCFPEQPAKSGSASKLNITCCRNCHVVPGETKPSFDALAVVVDSCSVCHRP